MAAEKITVYIDPQQLEAQKANHYSLLLAKMVNGQFTVIWQSRGAVATVNNPAYEYKNDFAIEVPSYEVNYGTVTTIDGSVTFEAGGLAQSIDIGQTVELDANGLFGTPSNQGAVGEITIVNSLEGNPHAILLDDTGNPIFVNTQSGMDIGKATLTPIDTYQLWFDNYQDTGTIIAHNVSNAATVSFGGGTTDMVVSYNAAGAWQKGPLSQAIALADSVAEDILVTVLATFQYALTAAAVTYLLNNLISKFSGGLHPTEVTTSVGSVKMTMKFSGPQTRRILTALGLDKFETAVDQALKAAQNDPKSGLKDETWKVSEAGISVAY
jgi:hypothetical protein